VSTITIDVDDPSGIDAAVQSVVQDVINQVATMDLKRDMENLIVDLEKQHQAMFASERDADGNPWEPLSRWTVDKKGHDIRLYEFGDLEDSLTSKTGLSIRSITKSSDGITLEFGTRHRHSYVNHFGGPSSWGQTIPPRPHVGISEKTLDTFMNNLADDMVKQLQRGPSRTTTP